METPRSTTDVRVVPHQGRTAIAVDGRVIPGMSYFTYMLHAGRLDRDVLRQMVDSGTRIFFVLWQTWQPKNHAEPWAADGTIDFTPLDEWMAALAAMSDEVWFIPRLYFSTPAWWAARHPDDLTRLADEPLFDGQTNGEAQLLQASMASQQWRDDVADVLARIVDHVEQGPYGDRVLGYMVNSGGTEEWVAWGAQQGRLADYSACARDAFRAWLRERYGEPAVLARAWHLPGLTFEEAAIPSEAVRRRCEPAVARDPQLDQAAIDFDLFLSWLCADNLLAWCRVVKERTGGRRLTGAFYGYLLWQTGYASAVTNNGHLALRRLLDSPDIDFITGIVSYDNRGTGEPGTFILPVESVQAAGKLVFNEVDIRTHLSGNRPPRSEIDPGFRNTYAYNAQEAVSIYRREFAHHLIHGAAWWNFDMGGGWYACPGLQEEFARHAAIAGQALAWDMTSTAEAALLVSADSPARQRLFTMQQAMADFAWLDLQCDRATTPLYHAGLPLDGRLCDDLTRRDLGRYRLLYLFNAMYLSAGEREALERLKGDGRTIVFCGGSGMIDDTTCSADAASAATGIALRLAADRRPLRIDVTACDHPIFGDCDSAVTLGTGALIAPRLVVDDPDAEVLGVWRQTGEPAFAVKDFGTWRAVVCPSPIDHTGVARGLARVAGCHIWADPGRILFANRSLLAVHFADSHEPIRIHLPQPMTVTDAITGETVAHNARRFLIQREMRKHTTLLYRLQDHG